MYYYYYYGYKRYLYFPIQFLFLSSSFLQKIDNTKEDSGFKPNISTIVLIINELNAPGKETIFRDQYYDP